MPVGANPKLDSVARSGGLPAARLGVAVIQHDPVWENPAANRPVLDKLIARACSGGNIDLVLLPEMFSTGFSMNAPVLAETMDGPTVVWMLKTAFSRQVLVVGSLIIRVGDDFFNRGVCAFPDGSIQVYDKHHLFGYSGETGVYRSGDQRVEFPWRGFHVRLAICYDLRFPEWLRNTTSYDLLLVMASWPSSRQTAWDTLLAARAMENQCFVAAANRTGTEGLSNGLAYSGGSAILDWTGKPLWSGGYTEGVGMASLDRSRLVQARAEFPVLDDMDRPGVF